MLGGLGRLNDRAQSDDPHSVPIALNTIASEARDRITRDNQHDRWERRTRHAFLDCRKVTRIVSKYIWKQLTNPIVIDYDLVHPPAYADTVRPS